jgi:alditol oxidase
MLRNWSGTVDLRGGVSRPTTLAKVADLLRARTPGPILALGSAHSFSPIAVTPGTHIETTALPAEVTVDGATATVGAGMTYADVAPQLHRQGVALDAMASLPHITVGGAVATGTHGSGDHIGTLSSAVSGVEIVTPDGEIRWVRRGVDPEFAGWVVSLGALGVVTRIELDVVPTYDVAQTVFTGMDLDVVEEDLDGVFSAATSVSVFTRWRPEPDAQLWLKRRVDREGAWEGGDAFGRSPCAQAQHPLEILDPVNCTEQLGVAGPWHERLPHFRAAFTPSSGDEIQAEYLLPRANAVEAIRAIRGLHAMITPLLHVTEIRSMRADDLWLSPAYGADTVGIHFTWHKDDRIYTVLPAIEEALLPLGARPHWGKVTTASNDAIRQAFPRFGDFVDLVQRVDPTARCRSPFVQYLLGVAS